MRIKYIIILIAQFLFFSVSSAQTNVSVSGIVKDKNTKSILPYVNIVLKTQKDSVFISGTVTNEDGRFSISKVKSGNYFLEVSLIGYYTTYESLFVGNLNEFLDLKTIELEVKSSDLQDVVVMGKASQISNALNENGYKTRRGFMYTAGTVKRLIETFS